MTKSTLPSVIKEAILSDTIQRDITTARRSTLLEILWNERYLTRAQLIARVELRLGKNCFGVSAWQDTFYRDLRIVKQAFEAADYRLLYLTRSQIALFERVEIARSAKKQGQIYKWSWFRPSILKWLF